MHKQLSEKWARINVNMIAIFYLISGFFEYLLVMRGESESYFLLAIYHNYVAWLGFFTFIVGISLFFKTDISRRLALILAWWNLFTAPLLEIWWILYKVYIKKWSALPDSLLFMCGGVVIIIAIITIIRLYIIYMLRIDKAGYIFFKKKDN